jgi:hypothetical protein
MERMSQSRFSLRCVLFVVAPVGILVFIFGTMTRANLAA